MSYLLSNSELYLVEYGTGEKVQIIMSRKEIQRNGVYKRTDKTLKIYKLNFKKVEEIELCLFEPKK